MDGFLGDGRLTSRRRSFYEIEAVLSQRGS